ncbi:hypothetical protein ACM66B_005736 [Microbotryomycetes sp. NB124-2]
MNAQQLPPEILSLIFECCQFEDDQSGRDEQEASHPCDTAACLPRICRSWQVEANKALYRDVSLCNRVHAAAFLNTIRSNPNLAELVTNLSVGVCDKSEWSESWNDGTNLDLAGTSVLLVEVMERCTRVQQLAIGPLHRSVRDRVQSCWTQRRLVSLVLGPRPHLAPSLLPQQFQSTCHWPLYISTLQHLDIDVRCFDVLPELLLWKAVDRASSTTIGASEAGLPADRVYRHTATFRPTFVRVVEAAIASLVSLRLYFEDYPPPECLHDALRHAHRLRSLEYINNPPISPVWPAQTASSPQLDRVLVELASLVKLKVTAGDVSSHVVRSLPRSVSEATLIALGDSGMTEWWRELVDDLGTETNAPGLQRLTLTDAADPWPEAHLKKVKIACRQRKVVFAFTGELQSRNSEIAAAGESAGDESVVISAGTCLSK